jgi:hypothetical protein
MSDIVDESLVDEDWGVSREPLKTNTPSSFNRKKILNDKNWTDSGWERKNAINLDDGNASEESGEWGTFNDSLHLQKPSFEKKGDLKKKSGDKTFGGKGGGKKVIFIFFIFYFFFT